MASDNRWTKLADLKNEEIPFRAVTKTREASGFGPVLENGGLGVGRKIAIHVAGEVMAYVPGRVKVTGTGDFFPEKLKGIRKVIVGFVKKRLNEDEFLCKGAVQDISFAYHFEDVILGSVDVFGNVIVASVIVGPDMLDVFRLLSVNVGYTNPTRYHVLSWCPFVNDGHPDSDFVDPENVNLGRISRHLAVVYNNFVEVWNLDLILDKKGEPDPDKGVSLQKKLITKGRAQTAPLLHPVIDVCISPDCSVFACLQEDGTTTIFQLGDSFWSDGLPPKAIKTIPNPGIVELGDFGFIAVLDDYTKEVVEDIDEERLWATFVVGCGRKLVVYDACDRDWPILQKIDLSDVMDAKTKATKDPSGKYLLLSEIEGQTNVCLSFDNSKATRVGTFEANEPFKFSAFASSSKGFNVEIFSLGDSGLYEGFLGHGKDSLQKELPGSEDSLREVKEENPKVQVSEEPFCPIERVELAATYKSSSPKVAHYPSPIKLKHFKKQENNLIKPNPVKVVRCLDFSAADGEPYRDANNNPDPTLEIEKNVSADAIAVTQSGRSAFTKVAEKSEDEVKKEKAAREPPKESGILMSVKKTEVQFPRKSPKASAAVKMEKISAGAALRSAKPEGAGQNVEGNDGVMYELLDELRKLRFNQAKLPGHVKRTIQKEFERQGVRAGKRMSLESIDRLCIDSTFPRVFGVLNRALKELENNNRDEAWKILAGSRLNDLAELDYTDQLRKSRA